MTSPRAIAPDILRIIALFGIVVVNVGFMAFPVTGFGPEPSQNGPVDQVATALMRGIAEAKTYGLFSFMFGVGLGFQMRSAERRGAPFGKLYRNRMIGLFLLGLAHGLFFFSGDILVIYALTGSILFFFRNWTPARLVKVGAFLLVLQVISALGLAVLPSPIDPEIVALEREIMEGGDMGDVLVFRLFSYAFTLPFLLLYQGFAALGWFCLGLAAVKTGLIEDTADRMWQRARRVCVGPGVFLSLLGAGVATWSGALWGEWLLIVAAPVATLGYLGLIASFAQSLGSGSSGLLKVGASSLSIYLGQSIVLTTLFAPFGFGLWDAIGPAVAIALAIGVTLALMVFMMLWRQIFSLGPFEWVLRRITQMGVSSSATSDPS